MTCRYGICKKMYKKIGKLSLCARIYLKNRTIRLNSTCFFDQDVR